jgi:hypothetical protein
VPQSPADECFFSAAVGARLENVTDDQGGSFMNDHVRCFSSIICVNGPCSCNAAGLEQDDL